MVLGDGGAWAGFTQPGVQEETQSCKRRLGSCSDTWRCGERVGDWKALPVGGDRNAEVKAGRGASIEGVSRGPGRQKLGLTPGLNVLLLLHLLLLSLVLLLVVLLLCPTGEHGYAHDLQPSDSSTGVAGSPGGSRTCSSR